jgi:hypothetical protein
MAYKMPAQQQPYRHVSDQSSEDLNVTRIYGRRELEQAFLGAFDRVGGMSRLIQWAEDPNNYHAFLNLMVKFAPKEAVQEQGGTVLEYRSMIPQSSLNRPAPEAPIDGVLVISRD